MRQSIRLSLIACTMILIAEASVAQLWTELQEISTPNPEADDSMGISVSVDGTIALAGASGREGVGDDSGAAYVYRFDGVAWVEEQVLIASDTTEYQLFGYSVSNSGDLAVIGAPTAPIPPATVSDIGSVYVFRFDGVNWVEEQKLEPSDGDLEDGFGRSVAVDGDIIVVGAEDDDVALNAGAAYVFRHDGMSWIEEQKLVPIDVAANDRFGYSVAVHGDAVVVSSPRDDDLGSNSGSTFVYRFVGTDWVEQQKLTASDGMAGDWFGHSVAIRGDSIVVGACRDDGSTPTWLQAGSVYMFRFFFGTVWIEEQRVDAGLLADSNFGFSVAIDSDAIVVGAPAVGASGEEGSAHVYRYDGMQWVSEGAFAPLDAEVGDNFGYDVSISADMLLSGSTQHDGGALNSGCAYFFEGPLPRITDFTCISELTGVHLGWVNQDAYSQIEIRRAGILLATVPGDATEYVDSTAEDGEPYNYALTSFDGVDAMTPVSCFVTVGTFADFSRGDVNGDGSFDVSDPVFVLSSLFIMGSPQPPCQDAADSNDDGSFDISDAVYSLFSLFVPGSPAPPPPVSCAPDMTADPLDCVVSTGCP